MDAFFRLLRSALGRYHGCSVKEVSNTDLAHINRLLDAFVVDVAGVIVIVNGSGSGSGSGSGELNVSISGLNTSSHHCDHQRVAYQRSAFSFF